MKNVVVIKSYPEKRKRGQCKRSGPRVPKPDPPDIYYFQRCAGGVCISFGVENLVPPPRTRASSAAPLSPILAREVALQPLELLEDLLL